MELWIRSQNRKRLTKIEDVYMVEDEDEKDNILSFPKYYIGNTLVGHLGVYKTKERALEVLDEIHNMLQPKFILDTSSVKPSSNIYEENGYIFQNYSGDVMVQQLNTYVYEMPKE